MKNQSDIIREINALEKYKLKIINRVKSGNIKIGDKTLIKRLKNDIKTLRWVLTP